MRNGRASFIKRNLNRSRIFSGRYSLREQHAINCILLIAREVINQGQDKQNKIMESHAAFKMVKDI